MSGGTGVVGMIGYAPIVKVGSDRPLERDIYKELWERHPEYRMVSPGEQVAQVFLSQARPKAGAKVIDLGCGTGRGGFMLAFLGGMDVTLIDFTGAVCLDEDVRAMLVTQSHVMRFQEADLAQPLMTQAGAPLVAEYGYCCDVMEHIRPRLVDQVIINCLRSCQHVFFQISCEDDVCGALVGHQLHLSVHPYAWWLAKLNEFATVHWSEDKGSHCLFYVTAWLSGEKLSNAGELNIEEQAIRRNIEHNIKQGWRQAEPHGANALELMILGGGPTLPEFLPVIQELQRKGVGLVTLNGAYNWCLEHGLTPNATVVVDARPHNARFVRPVLPGTDDPRINPPGQAGCRYFICSQCDPQVFDGLPKDRTFIWHTGNQLGRDLIDAQYELWWTVPGGQTVLLRAIPLFRMLGYKRFHLFGCDSCIQEADLERTAQHHAYAQAENDSAVIVPVLVKTSNRVFQCHPWMAAQASQFIDLVKAYADEVELEVYGNGLLAHIVETGAALDDVGELEEPAVLGAGCIADEVKEQMQAQ